jgi:hypothetical protein
MLSEWLHPNPTTNLSHPIQIRLRVSPILPSFPHSSKKAVHLDSVIWTSSSLSHHVETEK